VKILATVGVEILEKRGEALSMLRKGPMLPSTKIHSRRHFVVGLKGREQELLATKPGPMGREQNGKRYGRNDRILMLFLWYSR
jgi:hypothetical protein